MFSSRALVVLAIFAILVGACVKGQLTFSPDWGKRSIGVMGSGNSPSVGGNGGFFDAQQQQQSQTNCKTANEMLLEIFRFVQSEAQLFVDCKHHE